MKGKVKLGTGPEVGRETIRDEWVLELEQDYLTTDDLFHGLALFPEMRLGWKRRSVPFT